MRKVVFGQNKVEKLKLTRYQTLTLLAALWEGLLPECRVDLSAVRNLSAVSSNSSSGGGGPKGMRV